MAFHFLLIHSKTFTLGTKGKPTGAPLLFLPVCWFHSFSTAFVHDVTCVLVLYLSTHSVSSFPVTLVLPHSCDVQWLVKNAEGEDWFFITTNSDWEHFESVKGLWAIVKEYPKPSTPASTSGTTSGTPILSIYLHLQQSRGLVHATFRKHGVDLATASWFVTPAAIECMGTQGNLLVVVPNAPTTYHTTWETRTLINISLLSSLNCCISLCLCISLYFFVFLCISLYFFVSLCSAHCTNQSPSIQ